MNRRIRVLQTRALPLGYVAVIDNELYYITKGQICQGIILFFNIILFFDTDEIICHPERS